MSAEATLPPEVTGHLLAEVDVIARRLARRIVTGVPLPDEFRRFGYMRSVTVACRDTLRTVVRLLHERRGPRARDLDHLGLMGARQAEMGVPLEVLLSAYRLAAKILWHEVIGEPARRHQLPPEAVIAVTGQVLEYVDDISAAVGQAYLETRERLMRQRDRDRDHVLRRLLAGDASEDLRRLAATADLTLQPPYRVYACSIQDGDAATALETASRLGALAIGDEPGVWSLLVAPEQDTPDFWAALERAAAERGGDGGRLVRGAGPVATSLDAVPGAAGQARRALRVGSRLSPDRSLHDDAEVGIFAALARDPDAVRRFVERLLGPLAGGGASRWDDLRATLDALLSTRSLGEAAGQLGLHRHTVVYRIRRLGEAGIDIDDPEQRHRLWLALIGRRLLDGGTREPAASA